MEQENRLDPAEEAQARQAAEQLRAICQRMGLEPLNAAIRQHAARLERLSDVNQRIGALDPEKQPEEYNAAVLRIMEETKDYYSYLAALPEDLRRFFQLAADAMILGDGALEELEGRLLGAFGPRGEGLIPSVQAVRPKKYIMQLDAISNRLAGLEGRAKLQVGRPGGHPIRTAVTLDIPEHMKIEGGAVLSTYDKSILNGVTSLLESGNTVFSIPMLYHAMTGKQNPTVDGELYEEFSGKLEKMRRMMLSIDLTEEYNAHFFTDEKGEPMRVENLVIEGYLLPLVRISGIINGRPAELYQLTGNPPLYTYSKMRRQLASVPLLLLNAPVNNNSTTIPLKTYLLQRIEMMRNSHNSIRSHTIRYESVYAELGDQDSSKTRKLRIRGYVNTILQYFVEQGYLQGFQEFREGRTVAGVRLQLPSGASGGGPAARPGKARQ